MRLRYRCYLHLAVLCHCKRHKYYATSVRPPRARTAHNLHVHGSVVEHPKRHAARAPSKPLADVCIVPIVEWVIQPRAKHGELSIGHVEHHICLLRDPPSATSNE